MKGMFLPADTTFNRNLKRKTLLPLTFEAVQRDKENETTNTSQDLRLGSRKVLQQKEISQVHRGYETPS